MVAHILDPFGVGTLITTGAEPLCRSERRVLFIALLFPAALGNLGTRRSAGRDAKVVRAIDPAKPAPMLGR